MVDINQSFGQPREDRAYQGKGLVMSMTAGQLERYNAEQEPVAQNTPVISSLASHINMCWSANKAAKQPIERVLLQCLRQRNGEYDPEVLDALRNQGEDNPIYMMITDIKCRAFESWLKDIMIPGGDPPFFFEPTPIPELPEEMQGFAKAKIVTGLQAKMQQMGIQKEQLTREHVLEIGEKTKKELHQMLVEQAKGDAEKITTEVNDILTEGGFYKALEEFIEDLATYPTAFIEGPIVRKKKVLVWEAGGGGKSVPAIKLKTVREFSRVSPFDIYPSSGAKTLDDGNLIRRIRYSPKDLQDMIGIEGFDEAAIREVLKLYGTGGLKHWLSIDSQRAVLQDHHNETGDPEPKIDCLKFMGSVQGNILAGWGMENIPDMDRVYPITAYLIGPFVISARINDNPLEKRNYFHSSFVRKNDSIWGRGVSQVLRDVTRLCNSAARSLQRNMGIASGPMAWVIEDRINPTQNVDNMHPWKMFKFTSGQVKNRTDLPMGFFNPNVIVNELLAIYKHFYDQASEVSGIPAYVYGSEKIGGAGTTATGLSMLMNAAGKVMRGTAQLMDNGIIKPCVEATWLHIMLYEPEKAIGDIKVIARASDYLMQIEQMQAAISEALKVTENAIDMQIIGQEGRGELLREYFKRLKMPVDKIVPDREAIIQDGLKARLAEIMQNLSQNLGIPPDQLIVLATQQAGQKQIGQPPGGNGGKPTPTPATPPEKQTGKNQQQKQLMRGDKTNMPRQPNRPPAPPKMPGGPSMENIK